MEANLNIAQTDNADDLVLEIYFDTITAPINASKRRKKPSQVSTDWQKWCQQGCIKHPLT